MDIDGSICFSSEMKSIHNISERIIQFKPGNIWDSKTNKYSEYYSLQDKYYNKYQPDYMYKMHKDKNLMNQWDLTRGNVST